MKKCGVLYISYLGLLEAIPQSQVLPYLLKLSDAAEIHLLTYEKRRLLRANLRDLELIDSKLKEKQIIWHRLVYHKHPKILSSFFDIFVGAMFSLCIVMRHKISIVHARSNIPVAIGFIIKLLAPVKLLYDRRGIMGEDHAEHSGWKEGGWLYRAAVYFENKAIKKSDAIVVLTQRMRQHLENKLAKRRTPGKEILIKTIPCCVDIDKFKYNYQGEQDLKNRLNLSGKFIFAYSGSLGTYNLLNEMFDFFATASDIIPNVHFLILTQNKDIVIKFLAERKNIDQKNVTLLSLSAEDVPMYLSIADAGLVFRKDSATAIAASPTKLGEYLACGIPVISMLKIGDVEAIIGSNKIGVVLKDYNYGEYKQALNELFILTKARDSLRERCRRFSEDFFSLARGVNVYSEIYNSLCRR